MARVATIWRHPIKSHGREELSGVTLVAGQAMPWDRRWAVLHDRSKVKPEAPAWAVCGNFVIGTRIAALAGIWAEMDEAEARITLRHPDLGEIRFRPDDPADQERFLSWVAPLSAGTSTPHKRLVSLAGRGWTDTDFPSVTVMNMASHRAVEDRHGSALHPARWRGNFWIDGLPAWEERQWIGKEIRIGAARLLVREEVIRCLHTAANPDTGKRDADTLGHLEALQDERVFGIYTEVVEGGRVAVGDAVEIL